VSHGHTQVWLAEKLKPPVDPNLVYMWFSRRVVTEGERVYCSDRELDHASVRDAQLRAADLVPFL
jgi:hypothetical protein